MPMPQQIIRGSSETATELLKCRAGKTLSDHLHLPQ